ncbi:MAG: VWA domain-containing protein [Clostridia bacterium]|nr:VWA domain-containing protein [Clostridia bacterium]
MEKKNNVSVVLGIIAAIIIVFGICIPSIFRENIKQVGDEFSKKVDRLFEDNTFYILSSSENEDLDEVVMDYANSKGYEIYIDHAGTLDIMQKLNSGEKYDAVWISNSMWLYMADSNVVKISDSKYTSINPVIFGITKSKAEELGFVGKNVYTRDIVNAIASGKLKFSMSNPTSTNSGASAYLGLLSTLAGNPEVLTEEILQDETLKQNLTTLFSGMERSSGDEDFLEELFIKGNYEAVVTYESSIISINKQLEKNGREPLYAIYPVDGVSISDSPFAYIDNKNDYKKEIFKDIQSFIISDEGQKILQTKGRRTWYGGVNNNADKTIFNPDWGIDTTKYISPVKYPSTKVTKLALNLYQNELRKPVHVVFCLDYSGSMFGTGYNQLKSAMNYILTEKAGEDFIQFSEKDKIDIVPFGTNVMGVWSTENGIETKDVLNKIENTSPNGSTALYPAAIKALELIQNEDRDTYNVSIILMTDGQANVGRFSDLETKYKQLGKNIPIYSITFGSASERELDKIANMTNAKVFDGKTDLVRAFKEVRGYN